MPFLRDRRNTDISDLGLNISASRLRGIANVFKFGLNDSLGTSMETVWAKGGIYTYPSTATTMTVSSDDTTDNLAGIGAWTVRISGLDANFLEIEEDISLHATNGQTGVTTVNSYLRVHRIVVLTTGSNASAKGNISVGTGTLTGGVPVNTYGYIQQGDNQTTQCVYTVPAGKTAFIVKTHTSLSAGKQAEVHLMASEQNSVFHVHFVNHIYQTALIYEFTNPIKFIEKTDIEIRAKMSATTGAISAHFELILIDNDLLT